MAKYKLYNSEKVHDLREMIEKSSIRYPNKTAFLQKVDGKYKPVSYIRFKNDIDSFGTALTQRGFAGKRVIVLGENCYSWCLAYMTVTCGLGAVVPVDKEIPAEEVANIAKISEAALIIYSKKYEAKVAQLPESIEKIAFDEMVSYIIDGAELLSAGNKDYLELSIDRDALCSLIFTSGTTGVSKGVMLSQ